MSVIKPRRREWTREEVFELIRLYHENIILWDTAHPLYSHRNHKAKIRVMMADRFATTVDEVMKKIHILRGQMQTELKRMKSNESYRPGWIYFDALKFLRFSGDLNQDHVETLEEQNQLNQGKVPYFEFGIQKDAFDDDDDSTNSLVIDLSVVPETNTPKRPREEDKETQTAESETNKDHDQIFGNYLATVLSGFSHRSNKKLRTVIQRAIVEIQEEEDMCNWK